MLIGMQEGERAGKLHEEIFCHSPEGLGLRLASVQKAQNEAQHSLLRYKLIVSSASVPSTPVTSIICHSWHFISELIALHFQL